MSSVYRVVYCIKEAIFNDVWPFSVTCVETLKTIRVNLSSTIPSLLNDSINLTTVVMMHILNSGWQAYFYYEPSVSKAV